MSVISLCAIVELSERDGAPIDDDNLNGDREILRMTDRNGTYIEREPEPRALVGMCGKIQRPETPYPEPENDDTELRTLASMGLLVDVS